MKILTEQEQLRLELSDVSFFIQSLDEISESIRVKLSKRKDTIFYNKNKTKLLKYEYGQVITIIRFITRYQESLIKRVDESSSTTSKIKTKTL